MSKRTLTLALLLALLPASLLLAGAEGRLKGFVKDKDGKPIIGAKVLVAAQEVSATRQTVTKKGGKFVMIVADATRNYTIRIEAEGYQTIQEPLKLNVGGQLVKDWVMFAGETVEGATVVETHGPGARVYNEGAKAFNKGEIDIALAKFVEASQINPELAEAFQGQATIYWAREQTQEALAAAEKAVSLDPENMLGLRVRYDAYLELGDERADEALAALVAVDSSPGTARRIFNAGVAAVNANELEAAIQHFEKAVEFDAGLAQGFHVLGQLYNSVKQHDLAIANAEKLLALVPDSPEAHSVLYEAYRATGDTAKADTSWAILRQSKPEDLARALADEGQLLFQDGNVAAAADKLEQAIELDPNQALAHYTLGLCKLNSGEQTAAKQLLERFVELAPDHPEAGAARDMISFLQ